VEVHFAAAEGNTSFAYLFSRNKLFLTKNAFVHHKRELAVWCKVIAKLAS
jgi:hypothetical protein